jgi:hypothetical protein
MLLIQLHSNLRIWPYLKTYDTWGVYSLNKHNRPIDNAYSATRHQLSMYSGISRSCCLFSYTAICESDHIWRRMIHRDFIHWISIIWTMLIRQHGTKLSMYSGISLSCSLFSYPAICKWDHIWRRMIDLDCIHWISIIGLLTMLIQQDDTNYPCIRGSHFHAAY